MRSVTLLCLGRILAIGAAVVGSVCAAPAYDPRPWLSDLDQVRTVLLTKYANLEWAVFDREANLPQLFQQAQQHVQSAGNDLEARAAFDALARKLGDGHVGFQWQTAQAGPAGATRSCGDYDSKMVSAPLVVNAPGYRAIATPDAGLFPIGIIERGEQRVGVIRIALFEPQGYPELCRQALTALSIPSQMPCDEACHNRVGDFAARAFAEAFTRQLAALSAAHIDVLLVDVSHNGGGSEWAEAAARQLTPKRLKSERLHFVRGAHWVKKFAELEKDLREAAAKAVSVDDRKRLRGWAAEASAKGRIAATPCAGQPLWNGKHPACAWLGEGFFATGVLDAADPDELRGKTWATDVFSPMQFPYVEGAWRGPLIVLVDSETWSAAEEFAAVLQDNKAAIIMGEPTGGAGCGHTDGGTPTVLNNSRTVMAVPDCARIRADGSNEVRGIEPDVLVGFRRSDGPHARARAVAEKIGDAVAAARQLSR